MVEVEQQAIVKDSLISPNKVTSFKKLEDSLSSKLVGQKELIKSLLISLLAQGHILIEGMPGLAKTTAAKALAMAVNCGFNRIQFTPDLLPSDVIGSEIYIHDKSSFEFKKGPIFESFVLADEINRAPAKVQSALLECMEEHQVSVGGKKYQLPELFMVLATQNPIEQAGTYLLPEAQLDRFFMHVKVDYPSHEEELAILDLEKRHDDYHKYENTKIKVEDVLQAQQQVKQIYIDVKLKHYIVSLVRATRQAGAYDPSLKELIRYGASPRATIAIEKAAKACAWLEASEYVTPRHIQYVAPNILRHRIMLSFEAQTDDVDTDSIIKKLIDLVAVP